MAPIDDDTLDRMLTRHLSARLDGQVGRAEAAFRQRLAGIDDNDVAPLRLVGDSDGPQSATHALRQPSVSFWNRPAGWITGIAGTAVAASLATLMLLPGTWLDPNGDQSGQQVAVTQPSGGGSSDIRPTADQPMVRFVYNQTWDEGTVTPNGVSTPVRRVRHQQVEHLRYFDAARGAWVEVTVPKEDVRDFVLDSY